MWLSNRPQHFFEWSQASVQMNLSLGGPWVCSMKEKSLEEQAREADIGDRAQNLLFIGEYTKQEQELIINALDSCLVTDEEWKGMLSNSLKQKVCTDPFNKIDKGTVEDCCTKGSCNN